MFVGNATIGITAKILTFRTTKMVLPSVAKLIIILSVRKIVVAQIREKKRH